MSTKGHEAGRSVSLLISVFHFKSGDKLSPPRSEGAVLRLRPPGAQSLRGEPDVFRAGDFEGGGAFETFLF